MLNYNRRIITPFFFLAPCCYLLEFIILIYFKQSHSLNGVLGGLWTLGQAGILVTLYFLYKGKIADKSNWKIFGVAIAGCGALAYSINYIFGYWFNLNTRMFLPLGALLTGIGMIITGVQVLTGKRWLGIKRFTPLLVGLYPFLVMFPLLILTGHPDLNAIMLWGIPWLLLSLAMSGSDNLRHFMTNRDKISTKDK